MATWMKPVFAGKTDAEEEIIVYVKTFRSVVDIFDNSGLSQERLDSSAVEFHIQLPDGKLWALPPGTKVETWFDPDRSMYHLRLTSSVWTGHAKGSRYDMVEAMNLPVIETP